MKMVAGRNPSVVELVEFAEAKLLNGQVFSVKFRDEFLFRDNPRSVALALIRKESLSFEEATFVKIVNELEQKNYIQDKFYSFYEKCQGYRRMSHIFDLMEEPYLFYTESFSEELEAKWNGRYKSFSALLDDLQLRTLFMRDIKLTFEEVSLLKIIDDLIEIHTTGSQLHYNKLYRDSPRKPLYLAKYVNEYDTETDTKTERYLIKNIVSHYPSKEFDLFIRILETETKVLFRLAQDRLYAISADSAEKDYIENKQIMQNAGKRFAVSIPYSEAQKSPIIYELDTIVLFNDIPDLHTLVQPTRVLIYLQAPAVVPPIAENFKTYIEQEINRYGTVDFYTSCYNDTAIRFGVGDTIFIYPYMDDIIDYLDERQNYDNEGEMASLLTHW